MSSSLDKLDLPFTSQNMAKKIFAADLPEQYIRSIPAQALYVAMKRNGLESSADLLEIAGLDQCRVMIDFDCWQKSYFKEDNFWEWLSLSTEDDGLTLLQKLLKCFDLKIVTLLIARYVDYEIFDEPTDSPPGPGFYTPDKGSTWISIKIEDANRHFLMGRLLALVFETDAELFYKLLTLSATQTPSVLEEEAYLDKSKRLAAEGIPEAEVAAKVNSPADESQIRALLAGASPAGKVIDIRAVEPLIFDSYLGDSLTELMRDMSIREDLENELTYLMNSAIVHFGVDFYEYDRLLHLGRKVKGAITIGIEKIREISRLSLQETYTQIGLTKIYQLGLAELKALRLKLKELQKNAITPNQELEAVLTLGTTPFPEMPYFLKSGDRQNELALDCSPSPIEHLAEIKKVIAFAGEALK